MQMAKREISRCNRQERRRRTAAAEESAAVADAPRPAFEDGAADRERLRLVRETVHTLPPLAYKVLVLYYFLDMAIADIAAELGTAMDGSRAVSAGREISSAAN